MLQGTAGSAAIKVCFLFFIYVSCVKQKVPSINIELSLEGGAAACAPPGPPPSRCAATPINIKLLREGGAAGHSVGRRGLRRHQDAERILC